MGLRGPTFAERKKERKRERKEERKKESSIQVI
jgi:hypothetical protein